MLELLLEFLWSITLSARSFGRCWKKPIKSFDIFLSVRMLQRTIDEYWDHTWRKKNYFFFLKFLKCWDIWNDVTCKTYKMLSTLTFWFRKSDATFYVVYDISTNMIRRGKIWRTFFMFKQGMTVWRYLFHDREVIADLFLKKKSQGDRKIWGSRSCDCAIFS